MSTMTVQIDSTLVAWNEAARSLGDTLSLSILGIVNSEAAHKKASAEDVAEAMPKVFIQSARAKVDGIEVSPSFVRGVAVRNLQSAQRTRWSRESGEAVVSVDDDSATVGQRNALEAAMAACGPTLDTMARTARDLSGDGALTMRPSLLSLTAVLADDSLARGPRTLIREILRDGLGRRPSRDYSGAMYAPLKVSLVAEVCGMDRPHSRAASLALRVAACHAYSTVEAAREGRETDTARISALTAEAMTYVTRDRTAAPMPGQSGWEYVPDMADMAALSGAVRPFQKIMGKRANTGGKGREGASAGQVGPDVPHGLGAGAYCPPSVPGMMTPANISARRATLKYEGDATAVRAQDARLTGAPCLSWDVVEGVKVCACGPLRGTPLALTVKAEGHGPAWWPGHTTARNGKVGPGLYVLLANRDTLHYTHILAPCASPGDRAGVLVCGCGSKRGTLTADGRHMRRV